MKSRYVRISAPFRVKMLFHVFVTHGHRKKTRGRRLPESCCQLFPAHNELITPACFTLPHDHAPVEKACLKGPNLSIIKAKRVCPVLSSQATVLRREAGGLDMPPNGWTNSLQETAMRKGSTIYRLLGIHAFCLILGLGHSSGTEITSDAQWLSLIHI